jgi:hypothetical protein
LRGEAFDLVIVDEAAMVREETYTDVLLPTLADRDGRMLLISTPKGRNWFWREWTRGSNDGQTIASFQAPTSANPMPTIQAAAAAARERVTDRTYRQEWLAEFVEGGGGVFANIRNCVVDPASTGACVFGIDWGKREDYTVVTVMDAVNKHVLHLARWQGVDYRIQVQRIEALTAQYQPGVIVAERNSMGDPLIEQLFYERGLPVQPFVTTNKSKTAAIDALALAFEHGKIGIPDTPWLLHELEAFEQRSTSLLGLPTYAAPDGMHDDGVISLALAYSGARWMGGDD